MSPLNQPKIDLFTVLFAYCTIFILVLVAAMASRSCGLIQEKIYDVPAQSSPFIR